MESGGRSSIMGSLGRTDMPVPTSTRKALFRAYGDESRPSTNQKKRRKKRPICINVTGTKYEVVRKVAEQFGTLTLKEDDPNCFLFWNDTAVPCERIGELKPYQHINHFAGMGEICRKDCLARNMARMMKKHPNDFDFVPKTWIFPAEYSIFQNYVHDLKRRKKTRTFIVKPANGSMGQGITLYRNGDKIPPQEHMIVQEYVDKPFLLEGFKFDLRVYVLVTSCDPLRIFLYPDGLVRMGTEQYLTPTDNNVEQLFMHLTNYSINKKNANFQRSADVSTGSKRSISFLTDYLRRKDYDIAVLWKDIADVLIKTIIVAEPHVLHAYRNCRPGGNTTNDSVCFEVLGFDVLLDRKLKPWVLEVNRAPSFGTDEKIDLDIKSGLLTDAFRLINMRTSDKRKGMAAQKAESQKRLLRPTKRITSENNNNERRKAEIKAKLAQVRRENAREDFENRNMGRFRRIYPPQDKFMKGKYDKLISDAFEIFLSGRAASIQQDAYRLLSGMIQEDELIDLLHQCDISDTATPEGSATGFRGPKPLSCMPTVVNREAEENDEDEDDDDDDDEEDGTADYSPASTPPLNEAIPNGDAVIAQDDRPASAVPHAPQPRASRPPTRANPTPMPPTPTPAQIGRRRPQSAQRPGSARPLSATQNSRNLSSSQRSRSLTRPKSSTNRIPPTGVNSAMEERLLSASILRDRQEELMKKMLQSLTEMRIKFPGKTDEEAGAILSQIEDSWKYHKPRIASYWLVKLDSIKRRKVIDIVRSNVKALVQRNWRTSDVESVRYYLIISKVFNRLLWSHGQGLWNCFSSTGGSWETIFNKSTEVISDVELEACRRVVKLCQDCLLIVYQFAADTKSSHQGAPPSSAAGEGRTPHQRSGSSWGPPTRITTWNSASPTAMVPISQRMSRLYPTNSLEKL